MGSVNLDETDKNIIRSLLSDSRSKYNVIAEKSGVSVDKVKQKYQKMIEGGLITGVTLQVDPRKEGKEIIAHFNIDVVYVDLIIKMLEEKEEIIFATHTMGRYDIFAIAMCDSLTKLKELVEEIKSLSIVQEFITNIWVGQYRLLPENLEID